MPMPAPFARILGDRPTPRLWCPPLTHFNADGSLDAARMAAHWRAMQPHAGGFLVPGSTGEGWELSAPEMDRLLEISLGLARDMGALVLVGMLRPDAAVAARDMAAFAARAKAETGLADPVEALAALGVAAFTACAATGADLPEVDMRQGLETILDLGLPTALYQLPQVTKNEIPPAMFADLAARFPNLVLFKDSSGGDRVADQAGDCGVFMVRGAENRYADCLKEGGGPYHGWLLGSANALHAPLRELLGLLESGRLDQARKLSKRLNRVMDQCFSLVADLKDANPFTNACKALDHWMAWGPTAMDQPMPMLHCGRRLPETVVRGAGMLLEADGLLPGQGYC